MNLRPVIAANSTKIPTGVVVASGFAAFIAVAVLAVYLFGRFPFAIWGVIDG
ncbi:MAG: hypothetical protein JF606_11980 [Burkholderiales bacterium]|nr:hypothetical protein [Burkholderiales bacterium]